MILSRHRGALSGIRWCRTDQIMSQSYRYIVANSIIHADTHCEMALEDDLLAPLYRYFVLETPSGDLSDQSVSFADRGWEKGLSGALKNAMNNVLDIDDPNDFLFTTSGESLKTEFRNYKLETPPLNDLARERGVIGVTPSEKTNYGKLFRHIRNCLAHGNFKLIRVDDCSPVFVFEDRERRGESGGSPNVTARFLLKSTTLQGWIDVLRQPQ